jgi:hypothetical protein
VSNQNILNSTVLWHVTPCSSSTPLWESQILQLKMSSRARVIPDEILDSILDSLTILTQLVITTNYSAIAISTSRFLVTASNSGDSSTSVLNVSLNGDSLRTEHSCNWLAAPNGQHRKYPSSVDVQLLMFNCPLSRISCLATDVAPLYRGCCLETNVISEPFASNGCFSDSTVFALSKYATTRYYAVNCRPHWAPYAWHTFTL